MHFMATQRILLIGGVSLIKGRVREAGIVMQEICNELEPILKEIGFVNNAPFNTVSLIIRFGENNNLVPEYGPINKRYSELPVAIEFELEGLRLANKDAVKSEFVAATLSVLLDVAKKYALPSKPLEVIKVG